MRRGEIALLLALTRHNKNKRHKTPNKLQKFFEIKKKEALENLENFEDISDNRYLLSKLDEVRKKITNLSSKDINDQSVVKFLTLTKMISEIKKEL